nr:unnamed protein product [Spirometra erinaceieuropaei]
MRPIWVQSLKSPDESKALSKILLKLVKKGRLRRLQALLRESVAHDVGSTTSASCNGAAAVYLLASIVDKRGRRLLHIACEQGHLRMLRFLVELGLPIEVFDKAGNSPAHSCLKYGVRFHRFAKCCELLVALLARNTELLYVRNNAGVSPVSLLESLWRLSPLHEREKGDEILMDFQELTDEFSSEPPTGFAATPTSSRETGTSNVEWNQRLLDELRFSQTSHEDYFSGFVETDTSEDPFETIRIEYERRHRRPTVNTRQTPTTSSAASVEQERQQFFQRHAEGLRKRGFLFTAAPARKSQLSEFLSQWQAFLSDHEPLTLGNLSHIPWLPVAEGDVPGLLRFVGHNFASLRQLQVDWHPDRFFSRLAPRLASEDVRRALTGRVNAISQLLNEGVAELRRHKADTQTAPNS